jgi:hypothetical protein
MGFGRFQPPARGAGWCYRGRGDVGPGFCAGFGAGDMSASMLMIAISTQRSATFSTSASIEPFPRRSAEYNAVAATSVPRRGDRARHARPVQIALAAMFTISATKVTLKKNETMPWAIAVRRIGFDAIATSETCDVMPMTNEK